MNKKFIFFEIFIQWIFLYLCRSALKVMPPIYFRHREENNNIRLNKFQQQNATPQPVGLHFQLWQTRANGDIVLHGADK